MRTFIGIVVGVVVAFAALLAIALIGDLLFPAGADADNRDPEQVSAAFSSAPAGAKLFLAFAWLGGTWAGAVAARFISRRGWTSWAVAALMLLAALPILFIVAMPAWLMFALFLAPLIGGLLGHHLPADRPIAARPEGAVDAQV